MKPPAVLLLPTLGLLLGAFTASAEPYVVVKEYNLLKDVKYGVMTLSRYNRSVRLIRKQNSVFSLAQRDAEKAWNMDGSLEGRYPGRGLSPRKLQKMMSYRTEAQAQKKVRKYEKQLAKKEERDRREGQEGGRGPQHCQSAGEGMPPGGGPGGGGMRPGRDDRKRDDSEKKEKQRRQLMESAQELLDQAIRNRLDIKRY